MAIPQRQVERLRVRVGHEERDACRSALLEHHLSGRLTAEELERREHAALDAVTNLDLARLLADLPQEQMNGQELTSPPRAGTTLTPVWTSLRIRSRVRWAVPPAAVAATGWFFTAPNPTDQQWLVAVVAGAFGYFGHQWASNRGSDD